MFDPRSLVRFFVVTVNSPMFPALARFDASWRTHTGRFSTGRCSQSHLQLVTDKHTMASRTGLSSKFDDTPCHQNTTCCQRWPNQRTTDPRSNERSAGWTRDTIILLVEQPARGWVTWRENGSDGSAKNGGKKGAEGREQRDREAARCGGQGRRGVSKLSLVAKEINSWKERRVSGERKGRNRTEERKGKKERKSSVERQQRGAYRGRGKGEERDHTGVHGGMKSSRERRTDVGRCFYERRAVCVDVNYIGGHGR